MKISIALNMPEVEVLKVETVEGSVVISVESTRQGRVCSQCGRTISRFAGYNDPIQVRHLPCFGQAAWISYRPKRYECAHCDGHPKTTQSVAWPAPRGSYSRAYEDHLLKGLVNSTLDEGSQTEGLG